MPITPAPPYPKSIGQMIRATDWNQAVDEIIRLDNAKVNRAGDRITGSLTVDGNVGIGVDNPLSALHVGTQLNVGPISSGPLVVGRIEVSGPSGEFAMIRRNLAAWPAAPIKGDRFVWYNPDGRCALWTEGDVLSVANNGDVTFTGNLLVPKTSDGFAVFSHRTYTGEALQPNNLKLEMASTGPLMVRPGAPPLTYEFAIGHTFSGFIVLGGGGGGGPSFVKRFSVNQNGDLSCSGSKAGYVVDFFINRVGDILEQGDVVVIGKNPKMQFYGSNNDIPIPEVDLTDHVYDTRVCGIVAKFVSEADIPSVDPPLVTAEEAKKLKKPIEHPLRAFAARPDQKDPTKVHDRQLGKMATLGAYAYCKVDCDIAPILAGDLLTTSPTKGHAQKVLDPTKALGAIVGKALAPLKKGKGKIPVLVTLQ